MLKQNSIISILALAASLLFVGCDWVKSDQDDCPSGSWLRLDFSYNLQNIDAASQLEDVTIQVYDSVGSYVRTLYSTKSERQLNNGLIELRDFAQGKYTFVVWAGVSGNQNMSMAHSFGIPYIDSLRVGLKYPKNIQDTDFGDVYYGRLANVRLNGGYELNTVKMMKDTNKLVCLVRSEDARPFTAENYTMEVTAANGTMDAKNTPLTGNTVTYHPYSAATVKVSDPEQADSVAAARFGFQLMRLMANDDSRLILKDKGSDNVLIDIPLTEYIGQISVLYEMYGIPLSEQEYLDRQDFHTFVLYISTEKGFNLVKLKVNNWIVRLLEDVSLRE